MWAVAHFTHGWEQRYATCIFPSHKWEAGRSVASSHTDSWSPWLHLYSKKLAMFVRNIFIPLWTCICNNPKMCAYDSHRTYRVLFTYHLFQSGPWLSVTFLTCSQRRIFVAWLHSRWTQSSLKHFKFELRINCKTCEWIYPWGKIQLKLRSC